MPKWGQLPSAVRPSEARLALKRSCLCGGLRRLLAQRLDADGLEHVQRLVRLDDAGQPDGRRAGERRRAAEPLDVVAVDEKAAIGDAAAMIFSWLIFSLCCSSLRSRW